MVAAKIAEAMNAHDIDAFVACFHDDYDSEQPAHPDRAFVGREQVRENWSAIFASTKDFRAELVRADAIGDVEWSEWRWQGTHDDGSRLDMAGVIVFGIRDDRVAWARLYVEPIEQGGAGIDAAVRDMAGEGSAMSDEDKGKWAETADEGIVPDELSGSDDAAFVGREAESDEPATEEGIDPSAGDHADATTQGGQNRPDDEEPDLRDAAGGPRQVDIDSAN